MGAAIFGKANIFRRIGEYLKGWHVHKYRSLRKSDAADFISRVKGYEKAGEDIRRISWFRFKILKLHRYHDLFFPKRDAKTDRGLRGHTGPLPEGGPDRIWLIQERVYDPEMFIKTIYHEHLHYKYPFLTEPEVYKRTALFCKAARLPLSPELEYALKHTPGEFARKYPNLCTRP